MVAMAIRLQSDLSLCLVFLLISHHRYLWYKQDVPNNGETLHKCQGITKAYRKIQNPLCLIFFACRTKLLFILSLKCLIMFHAACTAGNTYVRVLQINLVTRLDSANHSFNFASVKCVNIMLNLPGAVDIPKSELNLFIKRAN